MRESDPQRPWKTIGLLFALAGGATASSACSLLEQVSGDQCSTDGDCSARGFSGATCVSNACVAPSAVVDAAADADAGIWSCLGHVVLPPAPAGDVTLSFPLWNAVNDDPIPGVTVLPCAKLDLTCAAPLAPQTVTDANGFFSLQVPGGFDGFLQVGWSLSYPTVVYINPPQVNNTPQDDTDLVTTDEFAELTALVSETIDPTLGHLFIGTGDCNLNDAAGVHLALDHTAPNTLQAYLVSGLPSSDATETDAEGTFVAVNVPTGPLLVTATLAATGQRIGVATGNISAGQFTYLTLVPSP